MTVYKSTRGNAPHLNFNGVMMAGLAPDGGLYVPTEFPQLSLLDQEASYIDTALHVMMPFVGDSLKQDELRELLTDTYSVRTDGFSTDAVTPLVEIKPGLHIMELFHGPTLAFKDVALQLLGRLLNHQLQKTGQQVTIIGATSGDTGSAAIEGCRHCDNARIVILHPHNRTSEVQRRQMTCVDAPNVHNIAIEGNFDDCQNIVKTLFRDTAFRTDHNLTAVNSINWARIIAQSVYYAYALQQLPGKSVRFAVPTGNFGNVYAASVMQQCGLPISGLLIGSNRNDILTRFFETGTMTAREVEPSLSPSMDIQISSNFERALSRFMNVTDFMQEFQSNGNAQISPDIWQAMCETYTASRCDDDQTLATIKQIYDETGMILDPHTAIGVHAALAQNPDADHPIVATACAHPAKFPDAVERAIGQRPQLPDSLSDLFEREEYYTVLPSQADAVRDFIRTL